MEPIASSAAGSFRAPAGTGASELSALLRHGRVLSAEVLSHPADGTVLLALGRQTIPAQTDLRLDPGARFLVQVAEGAEGTVLQLLAPPEGEEGGLLSALRAVVGEERPLGELLGELARALRAHAAPPPELERLARALGTLVAQPEGGGAALRTLLQRLGLGHESALAALLGGRGARQAAESLRGDLKALLLAAVFALENGEPGELRQALARATAGVEAEQLLNLARARGGEPLVLPFPFPDGEGWATARLAVPPRAEESAGTRAQEDGAFRLSLHLELTRLGALRADFALFPQHLGVRLVVTRPELVAHVEAECERLRAALGDGRRRVELTVRLGTPEEAEQGFQPLDIRYLREHTLLDVAG